MIVMALQPTSILIGKHTAVGSESSHEAIRFLELSTRKQLSADFPQCSLGLVPQDSATIWCGGRLAQSR